MEQHTFRVVVELGRHGGRGPPQAFKDELAAQGGFVNGLVEDEGETLIYLVTCSDTAALAAIEGVELVE